MEKMFWRCFYVVVFSVFMIIVSLIYPYIEAYALAHRASSAPGGELMLFFVPFIAVIVVDTLRLMRSGRGEK